MSKYNIAIFDFLWYNLASFATCLWFGVMDSLFRVEFAWSFKLFIARRKDSLVDNA